MMPAVGCGNDEWDLQDRAAGYRGFVEDVADQGRGGKGTAIQGRQ